LTMADCAGEGKVQCSSTLFYSSGELKKTPSLGEEVKKRG
jgi:hypothetical protein